MTKFLVSTLLLLTASLSQAQSMSIYGVLDTSIQQYSDGSKTFTRSNDSGYVPGRLGFRASEDLGSGLRALMQLEGSIGLSQGQMGKTNELFNRQAWVGLSGNFGELRLGRTSVSMANDLDQFGSYAGIWFGTPINGTPLELGVFQKNVLRYTSPDIGGFSGSIGYVYGSDNQASAESAKQLGASVIFRSGKFKAGIGAHKIQAETSAAEKHMQGVMLAHDFGFVRASTLYIQGDNSDKSKVSSKASTTALTFPLPSDMAITFAYYDATNGSQASQNKGTAMNVGLTKHFSKRTNVYAGLASVNNEANSAMRINNITSAPATPGADTKATYVGVTHRF